jgi:septum formation protein
MRLVLASASPARSRLLTASGIPHSTLVSGVDENAVIATLPPTSTPTDIAQALAQVKAQTAAQYLDRNDPRRTYVVGCDSVLDLDGRPLGKPFDLADAARRWQVMRGRTGALRTGHTVIDLQANVWVNAVETTVVRFGTPDDDEVLAYLATGEPLNVAGGFTLDALSGPFIDGIDGDPSNVVGLSLPLLRTLMRQLGVRWTDLWTQATP